MLSRLRRNCGGKGSTVIKECLIGRATVKDFLTVQRRVLVLSQSPGIEYHHFFKKVAMLDN